jgi:hypothetical protein
MQNSHLGAIVCRRGHEITRYPEHYEGPTEFCSQCGAETIKARVAARRAKSRRSGVDRRAIGGPPFGGVEPGRATVVRK